MTTLPINPSPFNTSEKSSLIPVVVGSIVFHIVVFFLLPLAFKLISKPVVFVRPQTFQLVAMPRNVAMPAPKAPALAKPAPVQKVKPKAATKPVPASKVAAKPAEKKSVEENTDELEELLGSIDQPVSDMQPLAQGFKYPWYVQNVVSKVESFWRPPAGYNKKNDVFVIVSFTVFSAGTISNVVVTRSSGEQILDNLAVRAIKLAAPFGKLPAGFAENSLEISYTLRPSAQ